jgi:hypothetical protein
MKVAVDFSHLVQLVDLRTMEKSYYLVPEGQPIPMLVQHATIDTLKQLLNPQLVDELVQPAATAVPEDVVTHVQSPPAAPEPVPQAASVLAPGVLGSGRTDAFGAGEG